MKKINLVIICFLLTLKTFVFAQEVNTELLKQCKYCEIEEVKALISKGANINYADEDGTTPLIQAVSKGVDCKSVIDILLSNTKINIKAKNKENCNLLHVISEGEELTGYVSKFKAAGVDINAINANGETPLVTAIKEKNGQIVKELIENGADLSLKFEDQLPLELALDKDNSEVIEAFVYGKISNEDASKIICYCKTQETILKAIELGADINTTNCNDEKDPLLIHLLFNDKTAIIDVILKKGANVNCKDAEGTPAIFYAEGDELKLLLSYKPDLNVIDKKGRTIAQDCIEYYVGNPMFSSYKTGLENLKIFVDNGYQIPKTIAGKPIIKFIEEYEYTPSANDKTKPEVLASIKEKNKLKKQEVISYLKSKGIK